ncbi:asparagine synthetase B family protein [Solidesulfovibrio sp.]
MSRIFGVLQYGGVPRESLDGLGRTMGLSRNWALADVDAGPCALAAAGNPPQVSRFGPVVCVVDGQALGDAGQAGRTMAETVAEHGFEQALAAHAGEFAVAAFDAREEVLWLGRDRVGIRPMYYATFQDGFAFSQRPGPLLRLPGVSGEINRRFAALFAASHYRTIDNDPQASPYAGVRQLPAGCLLRVDRQGMRLSRWWRIADAPVLTEGLDALAQRYRELLSQAVGTRLAAAGQPGFTLSGGMDSSSILGTAVRLTGRTQQAFTAVYDDRTFDESEEAADMVGPAVSHWHAVRLGQIDLFGLVREMVAAHDEPVATATWLAHWEICRKAAGAGRTHLFGGLGGDELNAGEYEYFFYHFADLRAAGQEEALAREIQGWASHHDHPVWQKNRAVAEDGLARLADLSKPGRCLPDRRRIERYRQALRPEYFDLCSFEPFMDAPFTSYLHNRTWQDISLEAAPCCLRAEDRQTRAFGLVNVDPFYDHRLLEFMFRVPGTFKIRDGVTKVLLREAMRGTLPEATRTRVKKTGWNAPAHIWFTGKQAGRLRDMIGSPAFRAAEIYDVREVTRLLDEHCAIVASGRPLENHMMFFWQLLNLETWLGLVASRGEGP